MSGRAVRQQFMREFQRLSRNTPIVSGLTVTSYAAQTIGSIGCGYWLLGQQLSVWTGLAVAVLALFIGTRLRGFNNIVHECSHFTFCERREHNVLFGSICASVILGCFRDYRDEHMTHHAHLGDYEHDRDLQGIRDLRLEDPLTPRTVMRHVLTVASGRHLPYYLSINLSSQDGKIYAALKGSLIAIGVAFLILDPVAAILLLWLPFVWVFTAINYLTDCIDHGGLINAADELDSSRNVPIAKQLRPLLFPRNDCYHLVHHLFPQVPAHHLDSCHERLLAHPDYRARMEVPALGRAVGSGIQVKGNWPVADRFFAQSTRS